VIQRDLSTEKINVDLTPFIAPHRLCPTSIDQINVDLTPFIG
jgi:hypothetical protein